MKLFRTNLLFIMFLLSFSLLANGQTRVAVVPLGSDESTRVFAQGDANGPGRTVTNSGRVEINSISISVPSSGFLVISGTAFINSFESSDERFTIVPQIDGENIRATPWTALIGLGATGNNLATGTLSYTITEPISAGTHTISQNIGAFSGTASWFFNAESLSVVYIRTGGVTSKASGPASATAQKASADTAADLLDEAGVPR